MNSPPICSVPDQRSPGLCFPRLQIPYGQTAKRYFAILKMEDWRLKGGYLSLRSDSPRKSTNTNGFNNHYVVRWNNLVVETIAGEPLISMRSFAVANCSTWLVSKESPLLSSSKPSYIKICYSIAPQSPALVSLQSSIQKTQGLQKPSLQILREDLNVRAGKSACMSVTSSGE